MYLLYSMNIFIDLNLNNIVLLSMLLYTFVLRREMTKILYSKQTSYVEKGTLRTRTYIGQFF